MNTLGAFVLPRIGAVFCTAFLLSSFAAIATEGSSPDESAQSASRTITVTNQDDLTQVTDHAQPGDVIVMADGIWKDTVVKLKKKATADQPITLRAQTPGHVFLTGTSYMEVEGSYLVISGLCFQDGTPSSDFHNAEKVIAIWADDCRLTDCAVVGYNRCKFWVYIDGQRNRVDHCLLQGKTTLCATLQVRVRETPNYTRIDHNYFGPRPPSGSDSAETLQIGYSEDSMSTSRALVEHNLFEHCDGEEEVVCNKSCENTYRYNTFRECVGTLSLRHGDRCLVDGNFFFGGHIAETGGVRVMGRGHVLINNYFEALGGRDHGIVALHLGRVNSPKDGYFAADNALVAFNTFADNEGPYLQLTAGLADHEGTISPRNVTIANNILLGSPACERIVDGVPGDGFKWLGNIAFGANPGVPAMEGITIADPKLVRGADGLLRPASVSPARGSAKGSFPIVKTDMDGQARLGALDCGADQDSTAPVLNRPLKRSDVGPSWMMEKANTSAFASPAPVPGSGGRSSFCSGHYQERRAWGSTSPKADALSASGSPRQCSGLGRIPGPAPHISRGRANHPWEFDLL